MILQALEYETGMFLSHKKKEILIKFFIVFFWKDINFISEIVVLQFCCRTR